MRAGLIVSLLSLAGLVGCTDPTPPSVPQGPAGQGVATQPGSLPVTLDGRPFELWSGREPAVSTVLVFTRSDCPISNRYAPTLGRLIEHYRPLGVEFFLVYVDPREDAQSIRRHLKEYAYDCRGLHDPSHRLVKQCGATVTPEAVVFDAHEKIMYRGRIDDLYVDFGQSRKEAATHELADAIDAVISQLPIHEPFTKAVGCYIGDLK